MKKLSLKDSESLMAILKNRFDRNMVRHRSIQWVKVQKILEGNSEKLWSLNEMERTGGEPDVFDYGTKAGTLIFFDGSEQSPIGRRSVCYDHEALHARKENKPKNSAIGMASEMGIEILTEEQYRHLQKFGTFDTKTSSWIKTPEDIRLLGGAIFADFRYGNIFVYHNGAESYYAARGFRGSLVV